MRIHESALPRFRFVAPQVRAMGDRVKPEQSAQTHSSRDRGRVTGHVFESEASWDLLQAGFLVFDHLLTLRPIAECIGSPASAMGFESPKVRHVESFCTITVSLLLRTLSAPANRRSAFLLGRTVARTDRHA